ncbi:MAG TPA: hypothetical protein VD790_09500 [Thermoleophilaceae bacterium]|nr:hypothetical protein [Thermoleophilaceae bacterium]
MTTQITLEIRPDGDTFAGLATSATDRREFHGWLGLMGALEALSPAISPDSKDKEQNSR